MREISCCFTGHRPAAFPFGNDETHPECVQLKARLRVVIEKAVQEGYRVFYTGMAEGFDLYAAEEVLQLKVYNPEIRLIAALPCRDQTKSWKTASVARHKRILALADDVVLVSEAYTRFCMQKRNEYMVDRSSLCIACCLQLKGGTYNTLKYAFDRGVNIVSV